MKEQIKKPNQPGPSGLDLYQQESYREAENKIRQELPHLSTYYHLIHVVSARLANLAGEMSDQGRYAEAESLYLRALDIDETANSYKSSHFDKLALLLQTQGRMTEVESLYRRGLAICEKAGRDDIIISHPLSRLGTVLHKQGHYAEAEALYRRALVPFEKEDIRHADRFYALTALGHTLLAQNRHIEAESLYRRTLAIFDHPDHACRLDNTATTFHNLAKLYKTQGRYDDAEPLYRRALAIREKTLGPHYPDTVENRNDLAKLLEKAQELMKVKRPGTGC